MAKWRPSRNIRTYCVLHGVTVTPDWLGPESGYSFEAPPGHHFAKSGLHEIIAIKSDAEFWSRAGGGLERCHPDCGWWPTEEESKALQTNCF